MNNYYRISPQYFADYSLPECKHECFAKWRVYFQCIHHDIHVCSTKNDILRTPPALRQKKLIVNPISVMPVAVEHFYSDT